MNIGAYKKLSFKLLISVLILFFNGCGPSQEGQEKRSIFSIVTTTGMLGDAVVHIVGDGAEVTSLMGPGVDPHLYKASFSDLGLLENADVVIYNGLHLEGKMGEVLEKFAVQKTVIAAADEIDTQQLIKSDSIGTAYDPHVWFDVSLWQQIVLTLSEELAKAQPEKADIFRENANLYVDSLRRLHQWVDSSIATIPSIRRVLITAHDAFGYFGRAYDIEVKGLQGISTVSEFGLRDVRDLVDFIVQRNIKAVFVESSIPRRSLEAVVSGVRESGGQLAIGGTLFSDAMGAAGTKEGTYIGMVEHNVKTIIRGLN